MAAQTQVSNLAARLGARLSGANEQHKDKPVDTGFQRLPGGIKNGVAKLQLMVVEQYKDDKAGPGTKGLDRFRASAVVVFSGNTNTPHEHAGIKVTGMQTSMFVPLCDLPQVGERKATTFEENFFEFQNLFKMLRIAPCPETRATDPTGTKTWAYFVAAMQTLTNPANGPVYFSFSTTEWKGKKRLNETQEQYDKREPMVFENWHERVDWAGLPNTPPGGVNVVSSNGQAAPSAESGPPEVGPDGLAVGRAPTQEERVSALIHLANNENEEARDRLKVMVLARGWTEEQWEEGNWEDVERMALTDPEEGGEEEKEEFVPEVGGTYKFAKRDKGGNKLKNATNEDLPAQEVVVSSINEESKTCTLKYSKDGRAVQDASRKVIQVKWEWLE